MGGCKESRAPSSPNKECAWRFFQILGGSTSDREPASHNMGSYPFVLAEDRSETERIPAFNHLHRANIQGKNAFKVGFH